VFIKSQDPCSSLRRQHASCRTTADADLSGSEALQQLFVNCADILARRRKLVLIALAIIDGDYADFAEVGYRNGFGAADVSRASEESAAMQVNEDACAVQSVQRREFLDGNATQPSCSDVDREGVEKPLRQWAGKRHVDVGAEAIGHRLEIRFGGEVLGPRDHYPRRPAQCGRHERAGVIAERGGQRQRERRYVDGSVRVNLQFPVGVALFGWHETPLLIGCL
jgi:hypothetical protein